MTTLALLGGDRRQHILAKCLSAAGYHVTTRALGGGKSDTDTPLAAASAAILPMPVLRDGVLYAPLAAAPVAPEPLLAALPPACPIFAGGAPAELVSAAGGRPLYSYADNEPLAVSGAVSTAEGAVALAMELLPCTLWRTPVAVLGFGRIGKLLAHRLAAMGAEVHVFARRPEARAWALAYGYAAHAFDTPEHYTPMRAVCNTVPHIVLAHADLAYFTKGTLYLELASAPGVDAADARAYGLRVETAPGLPGKTAPETAGKALADALLPLLFDADILP